MTRRRCLPLPISWLAAGLASATLIACGDINVVEADPDTRPETTTPTDSGGGDTGADAAACEFGNDASCDDGDYCTIDQCATNLTCIYTPKTDVCLIDGACFDDGQLDPDNACRTCDLAQSATEWTTINCDDGNVCTDDLCDFQSGCVNANADDGTFCQDDACPLPGVCSSGACDAPCTVGSCGGLNCQDLVGPCAVADCVNDSCVVEPRPLGSPCDPGNACIKGATCTGGATCSGEWNALKCSCETDAECDDGRSCTTDVCTNEGCVSTLEDGWCLLFDTCFPDGAQHPSDACKFCDAANPNGWTPLSCDDGDECSYDYCSAQTGCGHLSDVGCCSTDADCADIETGACVSATCEAGKCVLTADDNGIACDDGNACTEADTCSNGTCAGSYKSCPDGGTCTIGVCDPFSGACSVQNAPPGYGCNDDQYCTIDDACNGLGECIGLARDCSAFDTTCTDWACDEDTDTCVSSPLEGLLCDDGDDCTVGDLCDAGGFCGGVFDPGLDGCSCTLDPTSCDDGLDCTTDTCLATAQCENAPDAGTCAIDGACQQADDIDPNNPCQRCDPTQSSTTWVPVDCDDGNPCTDDFCDASSGGCVHVSVGDGVACDDGDPCTSDTVCEAGICAGECECTAPEDCEATFGPAAACQLWSCSSFTCVPVPDVSLDGQACDDGAFCSTGETCQGGLCSGGVNVDCSSSGDGVCQVGVCDEDADACVTAPTTDGTACDDGDLCTTSDQCTGGSCGGSAADCTSANPCETGSCNPSTGGCEFVVNEGSSCDDGVDCTLADACTAGGVCTGAWDDANCGCSSDATCSSLSDSCNTGKCDLGTNTCYQDPNTGTACDDSNACTSGDMCQADGSCGGSTYVCTPPTSCQTSTCDGSGGCDESINSGFCLIGGTCYGDGELNPGNACQVCNASASNTAWSNVSNGTLCDADNNGCTEDDSCQAGVCTPGAQVSCLGDGLPCTDEVCQSTSNTAYTCNIVANGTGCFIGGDCYANGAENLGNPCQECQQSAPTAWSNKSDGTACDGDGDGCTADACSAGVCQVGAVETCDDTFDCTQDSCVPTGASTFQCNNVVAGAKCLIGGTCYDLGDPDPSNPCLSCTSASKTTWSNAPDGTPCVDGDGCTEFDTCQSGSCAAGAQVDCDDGEFCTIGTCTSTGPSTFTCDQAQTPGTCFIDNACYSDGEANPESFCDVCDADVTGSAWSGLTTLCWDNCVGSISQCENACGSATVAEVTACWSWCKNTGESVSQCDNYCQDGTNPCAQKSCWELCTQQGVPTTTCDNDCNTTTPEGSAACWAHCTTIGDSGNTCENSCGDGTPDGQVACWEYCTTTGTPTSTCDNYCSVTTAEGSAACWAHCTTQGDSGNTCENACGDGTAPGQVACWEYCTTQGTPTTTCDNYCSVTTTEGSAACWAHCTTQGDSGNTCENACGDGTAAGQVACWEYCTTQGTPTTTCDNYCSVTTSEGSAACWAHCTTQGDSGNTCENACGDGTAPGQVACWEYCTTQGTPTSTCDNYCSVTTNEGSAACWAHCIAQGDSVGTCENACGDATAAGQVACWGYCTTSNTSTSICDNDCSVTTPEGAEACWAHCTGQGDSVNQCADSCGSGTLGEVECWEYCTAQGTPTNTCDNSCTTQTPEGAQACWDHCSGLGESLTTCDGCGTFTEAEQVACWGHCSSLMESTGFCDNYCPVNTAGGSAACWGHCTGQGESLTACDNCGTSTEAGEVACWEYCGVLGTPTSTCDNSCPDATAGGAAACWSHCTGLQESLSTCDNCGTTTEAEQIACWNHCTVLSIPTSTCDNNCPDSTVGGSAACWAHCTGLQEGLSTCDNCGTTSEAQQIACWNHCTVLGIATNVCDNNCPTNTQGGEDACFAHCLGQGENSVSCAGWCN